LRWGNGIGTHSKSQKIFLVEELINMERNDREKEAVNLQGKSISGNNLNKWIIYARKNWKVLLTILPVFGVILGAIINFGLYLYGKGFADYVGIPEQYILLNTKVTIYRLLIWGTFTLLYIGINILTVRLWLEKGTFKMWMKRIVYTVILPTIVFAAMIILLSGQQSMIWEVLTEATCILLKGVSQFLVIHISMLAGIRYAFSQSLYEDLLQQKRKKLERFKEKGKKNGVSDENTKGENKSKIYEKRSSRNIGTVVIFAIAFLFLMYASYNTGKLVAQGQHTFPIIIIDQKEYMVVMSDGEYAIVKPCIVVNENKISVKQDEYMKVKCENINFKKYTFVEVEKD